MAAKTGLDCKLYRNTATWASPSWTLIGNIKDLTQNLEKVTADVSTRGSVWRRKKTGLKDGGIEFQMVWDTSDANFTAIQSAFLNDTTIELVALDGVITDAGNEGLRSDFEITAFSREEPLEDAVMVSVTAEPAYTDNTPTWYTSTT